MSRSTECLRILRGYIKSLLVLESEPMVTLATFRVFYDDDPILTPLCEELEWALNMGMKRHSTAWNWMKNVSVKIKQAPDKYNMESSTTLLNGIGAATKCPWVKTDVGRIRYFIRYSLVHQCLAELLSVLIHDPNKSNYYYEDSVVGHEELCEVFLNVLVLLRSIKFELDLENNVFLDQCWTLPYMLHITLVPCHSLGLNLHFIEGKGIVTGLECSGVAAENGSIQLGDMIVYYNGRPVTGTSKIRPSFTKEELSKPMNFSIIRASMRDSDLIFPCMVNIMRKLNLEDHILERIKNKSSDIYGNSVVCKHGHFSSSFAISFLGTLDTGDQYGESALYAAVKHANLVKKAISKSSNDNVACFHNTSKRRSSMETYIVSSNISDEYAPVSIECLQMGLKISNRTTGERMYHHPYMNIASVGTASASDRPEYFAFIASDVPVENASSYKCYVFHCGNMNAISDIVSSIAQGCNRTVFAV